MRLSFFRRPLSAGASFGPGRRRAVPEKVTQDAGPVEHRHPTVPIAIALATHTAPPYIVPVHTIVETPDYLRDAKAAGLSESEREAIATYIAQRPDAGDEIPGTGGARKVRSAGRGKGKSGGYRVVTFYSGQNIPVFLLNVFAKGDRIDLSQAERNELRQVLGALVAAYGKGVKRRV